MALSTPKRIARKFIKRIGQYLTRDLIPPREPNSSASSQLLFQLELRRWMLEGKPLPRLGDLGFKVYSQIDEDGILLALFAIVGSPHKTCVEICAGDGVECNTSNLILNHGWHGLLVDGNAELVARGREFYGHSPQTYCYPPVFAHAWVKRDSVNQLLTENGFSGDVDLLSLDMDGVDYWIWEAITAITPRVVVLEYQDNLGPDRSWTVPYADDFNGYRIASRNGLPNFSGASLTAFVKLARRKGYRLVAINRLGYNAFFLRQGLAENVIPTLEVRDCFSHPKVVQGMRERFPLIKDCPWVEV
jgi:hypothetical protein